MTTSYKKHHMMGGYDSSTYVRPLPNSTSQFKLYLSYRTYMVEMLT